MDYAAEVDDFAYHVGGDGVGAVDFQPVEAAGPAKAVNDVERQCHQQEAYAAGEEGHA